MMKRTTKPNTFLIEMVIVLLFFSLSASVILQLFVAAHDHSVRSEASTLATLMVEDLSAQLYASSLDGEAFFEANGWTRETDQYVKSEAAGSRTLSLVAQGGTTASEAGTLEEWLITIYDGNRQVASMPVARYVPKGQSERRATQ